MSLLERFEEKYIPEPNSGCWIWLGAISTNNDGYGSIRGEGGNSAKTQNAHRVSYQLYRGYIPADMDICHHCDSPWCVNPDHLFVGTRIDNMQDASQKGRLVCSDPNILRENRFRHEDKTVCVNGHPFNDVNTYLYIDKNGGPHRHCKTCIKEAKRRYRAKR